MVEIGGVGSAIVLARDSRNDLALLQTKALSGLDLEPLKVSSKSTRLGEEVIALGYPLRGVLGDGLNVTTGTVSALSGIGNNSTELQFTAPIQPGNSGGALVDRSGAVVGVTASSLNDLAALQGRFVPQGVNFAVRKEIIIAFLETHPKRLGARVGITSVLHTWGSAMTHHPHVHMIVPGGGISVDERRLGCRLHQQVVDHALVLVSDVTQLARQRVHDVKVRHRQQLRFALGQPSA